MAIFLALKNEYEERTNCGGTLTARKTCPYMVWPRFDCCGLWTLKALCPTCSSSPQSPRGVISLCVLVGRQRGEVDVLH
jgi:hypothetical protein